MGVPLQSSECVSMKANTRVEETEHTVESIAAAAGDAQGLWGKLSVHVAEEP